MIKKTSLIWFYQSILKIYFSKRSLDNVLRRTTSPLFHVIFRDFVGVKLQMRRIVVGCTRVRKAGALAAEVLGFSSSSSQIV